MPFEDSRLKILNAAKERFTRYGYEKTTVEDIGRSVGLNKASIYHYFKNKDEIYAEVIVGEAQALLQALQVALHGEKGSKDKILAYIKGHFEYSRQTIDKYKLDAGAFRSIGPVVEEIYRKLVDAEIENVAGILREGMSSGELKQDDERRVARAIVSIVFSGKERGQVSPEECMGRFDDLSFAVALILDGLAAKAKMAPSDA